MDFTFWQILFSENFHSYNKLFSSNVLSNVSNVSNVHLYTKQKEIKQKFTHHMIQYAH
jgi:hypothetical protein